MNSRFPEERSRGLVLPTAELAKVLKQALFPPPPPFHRHRHTKQECPLDVGVEQGARRNKRARKDIAWSSELGKSNRVEVLGVVTNSTPHSHCSTIAAAVRVHGSARRAWCPRELQTRGKQRGPLSLASKHEQKALRWSFPLDRPIGADASATDSAHDATRHPTLPQPPLCPSPMGRARICESLRNSRVNQSWEGGGGSAT